MQPRAIVVEDHPAHGHIAQITLEAQGIEVTHAVSLMDGIALCDTVLDSRNERRPTLLLTDIMLPAGPASALQCTLLLAYVATRIEQGLFHPAWLVAISAEVTPARAMEAQLAGAHHVMEKPLRYPDHGIMLAHILQQSPPYYHATAEQQCVRNTALQGLELLRGGHAGSVPIRWTKETAQLLLSDPYQLCSSEPYRSWIRQIGDVSTVYNRIRAGLHVQGDKYPTMLDVILRYRTERERVEQLHMSRATYYRHYHALVEYVATVLNTSHM